MILIGSLKVSVSSLVSTLELLPTPEVAKGTGSLEAFRSSKVLIGDCAETMITRASDAALPTQDILVRSNFTASWPIIWP